jgi:hypothetical protein
MLALVKKGVDSASKKNEYLRVKGGQRLRLTNSLPSVCQLSRKCGSLAVAQTRGHLRLVTGIGLYFLMKSHRTQDKLYL